MIWAKRDNNRQNFQGRRFCWHAFCFWRYGVATFPPPPATLQGALARDAIEGHLLPASHGRGNTFSRWRARAVARRYIAYQPFSAARASARAASMTARFAPIRRDASPAPFSLSWARRAGEEARAFGITGHLRNTPARWPPAHAAHRLSTAPHTMSSPPADWVRPPRTRRRSSWATLDADHHSLMPMPRADSTR